MASVVLLTLSGCTPSPASAINQNRVQATSTSTSVDYDSTERNTLLSDTRDTMAPNQQWGLSQDSTIAGNVKVVRKIDLSILATFPISPTLGPYLLFKSWAPDSLNLLMYSYDDIRSHAPVRRLIILHFDDVGGTLTPYIYPVPYSPREQHICPVVEWSDNSQKLAANINEREIIILDKQGRVIKKLQPYLLQGAKIGLLAWWPNDELHYNVVYKVKID